MFFLVIIVLINRLTYIVQIQKGSSILFVRYRTSHQLTIVYIPKIKIVVLIKVLELNIINV